METGLVNLKAELYKKRAEIKQFKTGERGLFSKNSGPKKVEKSEKVNSGVDSRAAKDLHEVSQETPTEARAKAILEEKAELYQKLHGGVEVLEDDSLNEKFLINFQKKIIDKVLNKKKYEEEKKQEEVEKENPDDYLADGPEDEWIEYTDALGRTRECMRKDLADMKQRDREVMGLDDNEKKTSDNEEEQYQDWAQHIQRTKWERQEAENRVKPNLHYQDVLFEEARNHGVGYVKLSGDAEKRKAQLDLLTQLRSDMEQASAAKSVSDAKKKRLMDIRLAKVKQRKRLKMGLPMTETIEDKLKTPQLSDDEGDDVVNPQIPVATPEPQNQDAPPTVKQSAAKKTSTREWDIGKSGVSSSLTQEEWVERNRCQRNKEFAPPSIYKTSGRDRHKKQRNGMGFGRDNCNKPEDQDQGQSSSTSQFWSSSFDSQPYRDGEVDEPRINEFAPPATYEYYGPSSKGNRNKSKKTDLDDAINQGLAYYRSKTQ